MNRVLITLIDTWQKGCRKDDSCLLHEIVFDKAFGILMVREHTLTESFAMNAPMIYVSLLSD